MSRLLGTCLLWNIVATLHIQRAKADIRISCPSVQRDFYPGVAPQNSSPPYVLNVTDKDGRPLHDFHFIGSEAIHTISLSGKQTGNQTEKFVGFIINIYNDFTDEPSGDFVTPLPQGVKEEECHYEARSYINEVVMNSTAKEWTNLQVQWKSPRKYPAGNIHIRASVIKEDGVYWDGINVTLKYMCPTPGCYLPDGCPHGLARNKYGCITCECAGVAAITVQFSSLLFIVIALLYNFM